ncbi:MAG: acyl-CoA thioesterase II [Pseudomonadota bacterium]
MNQDLKAVIDLLELERIDDLIFRGQSHDIGSPQVFGGQILGQALRAASLSVERGSAHSLHAYFLRPGDFNAPVIYQVERSRDGRSYCNRRVVAIQHGRPILNLAVSFHQLETGYEHQSEMPDVDGPEGLIRSIEINAAMIDRVPEKMRRLLAHRPPFEFRPVQAPKFIEPGPRPPRKHIWMRAWDPLPDCDELHRTLLTYVSDYELLGTSTLPHDLDFRTRAVQMASIDHALWFHRPFRVDEWLLYSLDSPSSHAGRGFSRGEVFTQDGTLVASVAQEGVIRPWNPPGPRS